MTTFRRLVLLGWTLTFSWAADPGATTYKIEKSLDLVTWTEITTAATRPASPTFTYQGTEPGMVYFRFSNCSASGCVLRPQDGFWHNEGLRPDNWPLRILVQ